MWTQSPMLIPTSRDSHRWLFAWWPFYLLVCLVIVFFWRFFFLGYVPVPGDLLSEQYPWAGISTPTKPQNESLGDIIELNYPWKRFTVARLRAGELPLWNPHVFGGNTHLANFQSPSLTPFNALYSILPFHIAYGLTLALQLGVSGFAMLAFLRTLGVGRAGATLGAVVFMFNAHFMMWFEWESVTGVALWLPLIWLAAERILAGGPWPWAVAGAGALGAQFLSGHLQFTSFNVMLLAGYVCVRAPAHLRARPQHLARAIWLLLGMVVAGVLLGAVQLLPSLEAIRWNGARGVRAFSDFRFPPWRALMVLGTLLSPYATGDPMSDTFVGYNHEDVLYLGTVPLALSVAALVLRRNPAACAFGLLAFGAAVLSLTPAYWLLYWLVPGYDRIQDPFRLAKYTLPVVGSVLAGLGLDAIIAPSTDRQRLVRAARLLGAGTVMLTALYVVGIWAVHHFRPAIVAAGRHYVETQVWNRPRHLGSLEYYYAKVDALYTGLISNFMPWHPTVWVPALALGAAVLGVAWRARGWAPAGWLAAGALGLTLVELVPLGLRYNPFVPPATLFSATPAIEFLRTKPQPFRIVSLDTLAHRNVQKVLTGAVPTLFGLNTISSYDSVIPRWMYEYLVAAILGPERWHEHPFTNRPRLPSPDSPLLPLLNVRYVVTTRPLDAPYLALVYNGEVRIYEDRRALPRAWIATNAVVDEDPERTLRRLADPAFDPAAVVLLSTNAPGAAPPQAKRPVASVATPSGFAKVIINVPLRVEVEATVGPLGGYLVLADTFFPGWHAQVNGTKAPIYRANHVMRAVPIGPGTHRVTFTYWPTPFWVGLALSLGTLATLGVAVLYYFWRRATWAILANSRARWNELA